jgi:hypothetical protein
MYEAGEITLDVRHVLMQTMERLLNDVLERADVTLAKQEHIAALLSALPLYNPSVLDQWKQRARTYPMPWVWLWCGLISPFVPALNKRSWPSATFCSSSSSPSAPLRSNSCWRTWDWITSTILVMVRPARRGPFAR